jgi:NitT/TauT family transport system substrate-binding protein
VTRARWIAGALLLAVALQACGSDKKSSTGATGNTVKSSTALRLGYFANVTHAPAVYGVQTGDFAKTLGPDVTLTTSIYKAGPEAVEALFSGAIDAAFVGPGPATSAYTKSNGDAARIVAGVASGGTFLVVKPTINSAADLKGKKIADPQLNGTQDIALRWYLKQHGYTTDTNGGGDVHIVPQENSQTLDTFKAGDIDGAWVPEPWASRLVQEGGGKVLVDERDLWPNKRFATTVLIVNPKYQQQHPDAVKALILATSNAADAISKDPAAAAKVVAAGIEKLTTKPIKTALVADSFKSISFGLDPIASSVYTVADRAAQLGLNKKADLKGIFDLALANEVLKEKGQAAVSSP